MRRTFWLPVLLLAGSAAWGQSGEETIGARYRAWAAALSGEMKADGSALLGTDVDVESTLDFGNRELFNDFSAWFNVPVIPVLDRINAGYWFGEFQEETILTETFNFGDNTFTIGERVDTELEFKVFTFSLETFLLEPGDDKLGLAIGLQVGVKYFQFRGAIRSETTGLDEEEEAKAPIPVLGVRVIGQITEWFRVEAELIGLAGRYGDIKGHFFEFMVEADFSPLPFLLIGVGYKGVFFSIEDKGGDTFEVDLRLDGFYGTIGFKF